MYEENKISKTPVSLQFPKNRLYIYVLRGFLKGRKGRTPEIGGLVGYMIECDKIIVNMSKRAKVIEIIPEHYIKIREEK